MSTTAIITPLTGDNRTVTIEVVGTQQAHTAHRTVVVPYSRLSQTMQQIHRQGGKVARVIANTAAAAQPTPPAVAGDAPAPVAATPVADKSAKSAPVAKDSHKGFANGADHQPSKKKKGR
jgi:hypothetical protein